MFSEFALEPQLLSNWRDYRFFITQFGVPRARLISRFPSRWKRMVIEAAQAAGEVEFLKITESLRNIDHLVVPRMHQWDPNKTWLPNAIEEHSNRPFTAIVARENPENIDAVLRGSDLDPANPPAAWAVRTSVQVVRSANNMAACVAPLLRVCKQAVFIDPHYDPSNRRHNEPLRAFLAAIAAREPQAALPTDIQYHTSDKNRDVATFIDNLGRRVRPLLPRTAKLTVIRWKVEELHNRYILTDRGGVMFGNGLDLDDSPNPSEDTVTLLDDATFTQLLLDYSPGSTRLTWLNDTHIVIG